jgi:DNA-binding XRE family transcriptional regulator
MNLTGNFSPFTGTKPPLTNKRKCPATIAALEKDPHASRVARALGDVSYATAWRIADRNAIALVAGREIMGRRLPPDRRAARTEARRANPDAPQNEIAQQAGVSRSSVRRIEGNGRRRHGVKPKARRAEWRICRQCS